MGRQENLMEMILEQISQLHRDKLAFRKLKIEFSHFFYFTNDEQTPERIYYFFHKFNNLHLLY